VDRHGDGSTGQAASKSGVIMHASEELTTVEHHLEAEQ
jgi:hypothetical protein